MNAPNPLFSKVAATRHAYFMGDLHGRYDFLEEALAHVDFDPSQGDILVSVGDLIDRGPDSIRCLELLNEPWFYAVKGNHEQMALDCLADFDDKTARAFWMGNGGSWYFGLDQSERLYANQLFAELVDPLPLALEITLPEGQRIGVVHAELPVLDWSQIGDLISDPVNQEHVLWSRKRLGSWQRRMHEPRIAENRPKRVEGIHALVSGHTPVKSYECWGNCLYIDGGVARSNPLTLLSSDEVLQLVGANIDLSYGNRLKAWEREFLSQ